MDIKDFTENKEILLLIKEAKETIQKKREKDPDFAFSDVKDNEGNYYVDLVQEGGGVLGIALVGYTYILEQMGIRFLKLAGTSAGAINTMMMAAAGKPQEGKSTKVVDILANTDLNVFVDGDSDARKFIEAVNSGDGVMNLIWRGAQILDNLKEDMGLNPGRKFYKWLEDTLDSFGISKLSELCARMEDLPSEVLKQIKAPSHTGENKNWPIAIIAADITTETKAIFPHMGHLYFQNPESVNPAFFVRASMSVPLFFHPLLLEELPDNVQVKMDWEEIANYTGPHPDKVLFVDGGILSNFPIDIFHVRDRLPKRPTFGVKLGLDRNSINHVDEMDYKKLIFSSFEAARLMRDTDFINSNPDFEKLVSHVEIGEHNWLNFSLSDEDKLDLFVRGARAAASFIQNFDWKEYKNERRNQLLTVASNVLGTKVMDHINKAVEDRKVKSEGEDGGPVVSMSKRLQQADKFRKKEKATRGEAPQEMVAPDQREKEILEERLKMITLKERSFKLLWIDDKVREIRLYKDNEVKLIGSIGGDIDFATSSAKALEKLRENDFQYLFIVSDIKREEKKSEGIDFLNELVEQEGVEKIPPTIFYITDFDPSKGRPKYSFGITNSPIELIHLIADIVQRT